MTKQLALDTFASLVGPIPGGNDVGDGLPKSPSGTRAVLWLLPFLDDLDAGQLKAVKSGLLGEDQDNNTPVLQRAMVNPSGTSISDLMVFVNRIRDKLRKRYPSLRIPELILPRFAESNKFILSASPAAFRNDGLVIVDRGKLSVCAISVSPNALKVYENVVAGGEPSWRLEAAFAHEMVHCAQYAAVSDVAVIRGVVKRPWIMEGSAQWAQRKYAYDESGTPYDRPLPLPDTAVDFPASWSPELWDLYLGWYEDLLRESPKSLFLRSYDALGFYAHIENFGLDPWAAMMRMIVAAGHFGDFPARDQAAFHEAHQSAENAFISRWAMGMVRQPKLGPEWDTSGPGISNYVPTVETHVADDALLSFDVPAAATDREEVTFNILEDRILIVDTTASYGGLFWKSGSSGVQEEFARSPASAYCLDPGGCTCPKGQIYAGEYRLKAIPVQRVDSLLIAFSGGSGPGKATVESRPFLCKPSMSCSSDASHRAPAGSATSIQGPSTITCAPPTCSSAGRQQVELIMGEPFDEGRDFSDQGTTGCLWLHMDSGGGITDYVIFGRRGPSPNFATGDAFEKFNVESEHRSCSRAESGSITCTALSEGVAIAERWFGPDDVLATNVDPPQGSIDPVSLALRILDEVPQ